MSARLNTMSMPNAPGTDWAPTRQSSIETHPIRPSDKGIFRSRSGSNFTTDLDEFTGNDAFDHYGDIPKVERRQQLTLAAGEKQVKATVLESDGASVQCEVENEGHRQILSFPKSLLPANLHFGSPIWIRLVTDAGARRFEIVPRVPEPDQLAIGRDDVDALVEFLNKD